MGQTLSEPITAKQSSSLQNQFLKVGSSSMQGWRISMEDAHTHMLTMSEDKDASFFAVYDGHGGAKIASHASKNLHKYVVRRQEYKEGNYAEAIVKGFLECDEAMHKDDALKLEMSGTTAITMLLRDNKMYVGNVGDSRCIVCIDGKAVALSTDHKPCDVIEKTRIEQAGGFVEFNRVNGNLALSRALGDFAFKDNANLPREQQVISSEPEVVEHDLTPGCQFALLACDGIWDVLKNQEVADFVVQGLAMGCEPDEVCEGLMEKCLAPDCSMGGLGCDNMTVILICFLHGQPFQKLRDQCLQIHKGWEEQRKEREAEDATNDEDDEEDDESNFVDAKADVDSCSNGGEEGSCAKPVNVDPTSQVEVDGV